LPIHFLLRPEKRCFIPEYLNVGPDVEILDMLQAARRFTPKSPSLRVYPLARVKPRDVFYRTESRHIRPILKSETNAETLKERELAISGAMWPGSYP
jgi:hypothetical protein